MKLLIILDKTACGSELSCNALTLSSALQKAGSLLDLNVFVTSNKPCPEQRTPCNTATQSKFIERVRNIVRSGGGFSICEGCEESDLLKELSSFDGVRHASIHDMAEQIVAADEVMVF